MLRPYGQVHRARKSVKRVKPRKIFGFSPDDVDWLRTDKTVHIRRQLAHDRGTLVFAPPKGGTEDDPRDRYVPLHDDLAAILAEHMRRFPPMAAMAPIASLSCFPSTPSLRRVGEESRSTQQRMRTEGNHFHAVSPSWAERRHAG